MNNEPTVVSLLLFLVCGVAIWIGLGFLASLMGWGRLARAYTDRTTPEGQDFGVVSAQIGGNLYKRCLSAVVDTKGLWLQLWPRFWLFHPPLLLPWSAFFIVKETKFLWIKRLWIKVQLPDGRHIKIAVRAALADAVRERIESAKVM